MNSNINEVKSDKSWKRIGPGGGGATLIPTVSPHDPDTVMMVSDMTGVYITHDGGLSWREINIKSRVDSIAFDPVRPDVIYAGSSGLFRSDDRGETWHLVFPHPDSIHGEQWRDDEADHYYISGDNWPGGKINAIYIDPEQTDHIYIGVVSDQLLIFYTTNGGKSWMGGYPVKGSESYSFYKFHKLYIDPTSPRDNRLLFIFTDGGAFRAETRHFFPEKLELPAEVVKITGAACGFHPEKQVPYLYITSQSYWREDRFHTGVYRSADRGQTWQMLEKGLLEDLPDRKKGQGRNYSMIAAVENDCRTVYLGVYRYPEIYDNPDPEVPNGLERYPELAQVKIADSSLPENFKGLMVSRNGGDSWQWSLKIGINIPDNLKGGWMARSYNSDWLISLEHMNTTMNNPDIFYYTSPFVTIRTVNGGVTWEQVYSTDHDDGSATSRGVDVTTCYGVHFDPFDRNHIVITYTDIGMHHSYNGGKSWYHSISGVPGLWENTCYWMVFDPEVKDRAWGAWAYSHDLPRGKMYESSFIEGAPGGVCVTTDGAKTWKVSNNGLPENCLVTHIVLDPESPANNRTLYITGHCRGVYKSTDDGRSWTLKNNGLGSNLFAWRLNLLPDGTLYLLLSRGKKDGQVVGGEIYKSIDEAKTWERVPMPEGTNAPNDLVFDPSNPRRMYLACWPEIPNAIEKKGGLYITEDGGLTWKNILDPLSYVYGVALHPDNPSIVFAVDFQGSVRRSDDRGESWYRLGGYNFKWGHRPIVDPYNKDMLYVTTYGSSVWYGPANGTGAAFEDICPK